MIIPQHKIITITQDTAIHEVNETITIYQNQKNINVIFFKSINEIIYTYGVII